MNSKVDACATSSMAAMMIRAVMKPCQSRPGGWLAISAVSGSGGGSVSAPNHDGEASVSGAGRIQPSAWWRWSALQYNACLPFTASTLGR